MDTTATACLIIIGNEILSGRTQDKNVQWLAQQLNEIGVRLLEVRVIPDIEQTIIDTVNACRAAYTYLFTTGGIGPTHDDITSASIAKAFGVKLIRHPEAEALLLKHYKLELVNEARMKMADVPEGATLISNPVSVAPGFTIGNVYVMAGVPSIMQGMFGFIRPLLKGGALMHSRTLTASVAEGTIAAELSAIQDAYPAIEIGSYPYMRPGEHGTSLVLRGTDQALLAQATQKVRQLLLRYTPDVAEE